MVFVLVVVAVPFVIGAVGFTPAGVAALSIAAYVQSVLCGAVVGPGSLFAFLQSAGVVGLGWLSKLFLGSTFGWLATYLPNMVYRLLYGEQEWIKEDNWRGGLDNLSCKISQTSISSKSQHTGTLQSFSFLFFSFFLLFFFSVEMANLHLTLIISFCRNYNSCNVSSFLFFFLETKNAIRESNGKSAQGCRIFVGAGLREQNTPFRPCCWLYEASCICSWTYSDSVSVE